MKIVVAFLVACLALPMSAIAAQTEPTSAPITCTQPDVPAATLNAVAPDTPAEAKAHFMGGRVDVQVTLDENDRVTSAVIYKSSSAIFNRAAIKAAQASTFRGAVKNCRHSGGPYLYVVRFMPAQNPPLIADPLTFFPGSWSCASADSRSTETFTRIDGVVNPGIHRVSSTGLDESLTRDEFGGWHEAAAGAKDAQAFAYPWTSPYWRFSGGSSETDYEKVDDKTFLRLTLTVDADGPHNLTTTRCTRV